MGYSIAVDGNTMVVGAPYTDAFGLQDTGVARVYLRNDAGGWDMQAELAASDGAAGDVFGYSVAISGDTAVVGALSDDGVSTDSGSAYVFTRSGSTWTEQQKLTTSDAAASDQFGVSVSVSGDTVVVGADYDDDKGDASGSAYVFARSGEVWTQQQKLTASDGSAYDYFGCSVSVSGNTAVVGAYGDDAGASSNCGSAIVFTRSGAVWTQQQKLTASDASASDQFGFSVSVSGDTVVAGANLDDSGALSNCGSAYVFVRSSGVWAQQSKIIAADAAASDNFGDSVSVSGDTAVVGAWANDHAGSNSGSAYVFTRSGVAWSQQQKLTASDAAAGDWFGWSVAVSGDTCAAGAYGDNTYSGSACVFTRSGSTWTQQAKVDSSESATGDQFAFSVALSGDAAVIGLPYDADGATTATGSAYVFTRGNSSWILQAKLKASDAAANDRFGYSVSVSGNTAVIGAFRDNSNTGSAYVFTRSGSTWSQQQKLTASDAAQGDCFGYCVSVSGESAIIGAIYDDAVGMDSGSAYVFTRSGTTWSQQQKLTASDAAAGDNLGVSVSLSSETAVVGAIYDDDGGTNSGAVYVFTRSASTWTQQQKLTASDPAANDLFGASVSVSSDTVVVGAIYDDNAAMDSGSAYIFLRSGSAWTQQQKLTASDGAAGDYFGAAVSISNEAVIVGAYGADGGTRVDSGSAYIFVRAGSVWNSWTKLLRSDPAAGDHYGFSVATDAGRAIVGAPVKDDPGIDSGAAYVFNLIPVVSDFFINSGAASTANRTVTLNNASAPLPSQYLASESPDFSGASWAAYGAAPSFTLSAALGTKTVYLKTRNAFGQSAPVSDEIVLEKPTATGSAWTLFR